MQEVHILKNVKLIDSPGVIASPSSPPVSLALRGLQEQEGQESVLEAVRCLLKQCDKSQVRQVPLTWKISWAVCEFIRWGWIVQLVFQIMLQYNIPDFRNSLEFLSLFAKKRGYLQKGGVPNMEQAATVFLADWTGWVFGFFSKKGERVSSFTVEMRTKTQVWISSWRLLIQLWSTLMQESCEKWWRVGTAACWSHSSVFPQSQAELPL